MLCNTAREFLLQTDWTAEQRRRAAEALAHLDQCQHCQEAMQSFDEIRLALSAGSVSEPTGGWDAMEQRLAKAAISGSRREYWRVGLAMAAALLLAIGFFEAGRQMSLRPSALITASNIAAEPPLATISPREISRDVRAFRQVSEVYDGRAGWMMVSKDDSDVGMSAGPAPVSKKVLLLRLNLWRGKELVSSADVMVLAGQRAELTMPLPSGQSLHYRIGASAEEPTRLVFSLEMTTSASGDTLAALSTKLRMEPGQRLSAGKLTTCAGEYELKIDFAGAEQAEAVP